MKIATWNVNSLRARLAHVTRWLDEHRPDVLLLQETKVADETFPLEPFLERGYYVAMHGQKSYNGVAILSRLPLTDVQPGFPSALPLPAELATPAPILLQARLLAATVQATIGGQLTPLRVMTAYVPNGGELDSPKFAYKAAFYRHLTATLDGTASPLIIGGDFNIAAAAADTDNPAKRVKDVLFTPAEQQWLADFLATTGLTDAFRLVSDAEKVFSWWDYRAAALENNRGMRIDYLFLSPTLKSAVTAVDHHKTERARDTPSDHIPVLLTLK